MMHYDSMQGLRTIPIEGSKYHGDNSPYSNKSRYTCKVCGGGFKHELDFDVRLGMCTACRHALYERHRKELEAGSDD